MTTLLDALDCLVDNGLEESDVEDLLDDLFKNNGFDDEDDIKVLALLRSRLHRGEGFTSNIEVTSYDDCTFDMDGETWMVLDEDERETVWDERLESYLDDGCVEGADSPYFDREAWKSDARMDGAGHTIGSYDGYEHNINTYNSGDGWYYLYRLN